MGVFSASRLKTASELKIALAGTSRRVIRERRTIDSNTDKPASPTSNYVIIKSHVIEYRKMELNAQLNVLSLNELCYTALNFGNLLLLSSSWLTVSIAIV